MVSKLLRQFAIWYQGQLWSSLRWEVVVHLIRCISDLMVGPLKMQYTRCVLYKPAFPQTSSFWRPRCSSACSPLTVWDQGQVTRGDIAVNDNDTDEADVQEVSGALLCV